MSFGDGCQKLIIYIKAGKVELHAVGFLFFVPRWHLLTLSFGSRQCGVKASDYQVRYCTQSKPFSEFQSV